MKLPIVSLGLILLLGHAALGAAGTTRTTMDVWPGKAPGELGTVGAEKAQTATLPDGTTVTTSLTNVSKPTLTVCRPEAAKNSGVAVLVFPGGGYNMLAWDHEGEQVARWLNSIGVTAAVLKYRVPRREGSPKDMPPVQALMDAQRAISLVRSKAAEWGVDSKRIGVLGFSAGGHLAAWSATNFDKRAYDKIDAADEVSCRPDFAVLIYPGGVVQRGTTALSPEIRVTPQTPPCFFAHANDDPVNSENSVAMYLALKRAKVPAELHIFAAGGHGFGLRPTGKPSATWPKRCEEWLQALGILKSGAAAAASASDSTSASEPPVRDVERVLVVRNENSPISKAVADDYAQRRAIPNVLSVRCQDSSADAGSETITFAAYERAIEKPIRSFLAAHAKIDFIVLTKGIPIRISDAPGRGADGHRPALDSYLAALDYDKSPAAASIHLRDGGFSGTTWANRFWNSSNRFSHAKFGGYLVTRLDGYTEADAKALTTRALAAEQTAGNAAEGKVLLDTCPAFGYADRKALPRPVTSDSSEMEYNVYNADMQRAADLLGSWRVPCELTQTDAFAGKRSGLLGYVSWGSNDRHYDAAAYHSLRFAPGALCETAVSTSARTFLPTQGGQSLIADLIAQGASGAKGYTDEPLLQAIAAPSILFDRYARGWTLAESFDAASRFVAWEDIVIGDPLCRASQAWKR